MKSCKLVSAPIRFFSLIYSVLSSVLSSVLCTVLFSLLLVSASQAEVVRIEVTERETLNSDAVEFTYELINGVVYFTLDPDVEANQAVTDIALAPLNGAGLVEYSADFKLLVPSSGIANGGLLYNVNNRGGSRVPPEVSLQHPLSELGFTYLVTGWINELEPRNGRIRLHAPVVGTAAEPVTGQVRYEVSVTNASNDVNIAGGGHLAYYPSEDGLANASLSKRLYQTDPRVPVERSEFSLSISEVADSNQPEILLNVDGGFEPGLIYELIYEAKDPVLAGSGMTGIRDLVSLMRYGGAGEGELQQLDLPELENAVAWGNSQSGRLLRQYVYDGFNADLEGRIVFDGVIPVIAGGGYGMFNNRFAMPTRTNGHHSNYLYPNDLFPFTYGDSTDPFTGRTDGVLRKARASGTVPKIMHIQTSNEYWLRGGSLPHTNPEGTADAELPEEVRFYTIGGSQHGSGDGVVRPPARGQLSNNPNMWAPISNSLIVAMYNWVAEGESPPPSRYPRIADGTLVASHVDGRVNRDAWNRLNGVNHPASMYQPTHNNYGSRWDSQRIIDQHPDYSDHFYQAMVPMVDTDNNDLPGSTILPPLASVPLGTFVSWNLRAPETGAERSLARLSGGYIPFPANTAVAVQSRDPRNSIAGLYPSYADYLSEFEAATDQLISEGYLLPGFKSDYMAIANSYAEIFE
mgnify:CR=1 FL=1